MGFPFSASSVTSIDALSAAVQAGAEEALEVAEHVHSYERWHAAAAVPNGEVHVADRIGIGNTPFTIDGGAGAGTGSWGSWVQIMGSSDTPVSAGKTRFDHHKLILTAAERNNTVYYIQFGYADSGAAALAANEIAEVIYRAGAAVTREASVAFQGKRHPAGTKVWARCWAVGQDTGTLSFLIGLHEYDE
jgi:hypothetical protein